ncbi:putative membrane protein [Sphingomonas vulcanisoli]|uniref:Membrane protein n=1 Tax=Sphingomonas vulcanisoli TaxID=1658060 RepID=A0ABX0TRX6_9SPHN|nr:SRPBCC family protein [Sphingomonas vulcanisoli]NIJ07484.1 putative membrane protein [Sphingomonas vulcanisoli]
MTNAANADAPATAARDKDARAAEAERDESQVSAAVVTIARPTRELYDFWRDFSNLAPIMENIESITVESDTRSIWTIKAPAGRTVSWEAVVTEDQPGALIAWESVEGADVRSSGRIEFRDTGARGSIVRAVIAYDPPAGLIGELIAKIFQREPAIQARRELRRFKQFMETGEVATSSRTRAHHAEHKAG